MGWFDGPGFNTEKSVRCFNVNLRGKCGSCIYLNINNSTSGFFSGYKYKCVRNNSYYPWDDRVCSKLDEIDPENVDCVRRYKDFTGRNFYHISTIIGLILGKNLNEKPFINIKKLKDFSELDENKKSIVKLYDVYGAMIATSLFNDLNNIEVCESYMPILNKVSDLIDNKNFDEAFETYYKMVVMLYGKYTYSLKRDKDLNKEEKTNKILVK